MDWPGYTHVHNPTLLSSVGFHSMAGQTNMVCGQNFATAAAWPAANRALYCPVMVTRPCTIYRMGWVCGSASGNYDIGVYNEAGTRLGSSGSTAVAGGANIANITDVPLSIGIYFLALNVDNGTATCLRTTLSPLVLQACGVQQEAVGAVTLPSTATFANPATAYMPCVVAFLSDTM